MILGPIAQKVLAVPRTSGCGPRVKQPDREVSSLILPSPVLRNTMVMVPSGPNRAGTAAWISGIVGAPLLFCAPVVLAGPFQFCGAPLKAP